VFKKILSPILFLMTFSDAAARPNTEMPEPSAEKKSISEMMRQLKNRTQQKGFRWEVELFTDQGWSQKGYTVNGMPLIYWSCGQSKETNRSLVLSAVHGDEITPVYYGLRLVEYLKERPELCKDRFIVVAPTINPDGFLRYRQGTRTNYNKVDVNRNFETDDWWDKALALWKTRFGGKRRRYPGPYPASEPETIFQQWLIEEFRPTKILSIHAPLKILDYDGPKTPLSSGFSKAYVKSCESLREGMAKATPLRHYAYGFFPGSLGNYAGKQRGIPTITAELPSTQARNASRYFNLMENSLKLFLSYKIEDSPYSHPPAQARQDTSSPSESKN
jgi:protein MpaA